MQRAFQQEERELEALQATQQRLATTCVQASTSRDACLATPINEDELSAVLEAVRSRLGAPTVHAAVDMLLAKQKENYDLFCSVHTADSSISALHESGKPASRVQVCIRSVACSAQHPGSSNTLLCAQRNLNNAM